MSINFQQLNQTLKSQQRAIPSVIIDLDALDENIEQLRLGFQDGQAFRIVVKSLPSRQLIEYVMAKTQATKLMVFHQPFLSELSSFCSSEVDILLGKPMPIKTAAYYFKHVSLNLPFDPFSQIQWLVDTEKRIEEYIGLAQQLDKPIRLNLEIDVGLHRGGFLSLDTLRNALNLVSKNKDYVTFSGLMGYDPHIPKIPSLLRSQERSLSLANGFYNQCKRLIKQDFPELWLEDLTFNGAGSPTVSLHQNGQSPLNDISAGSCLLKSTSFDVPTLTAYKPACYISTPVLKKFKETNLPGLEKFKSVLNLLNSRHKEAYFIYGGFWQAGYVYPKGIKQNKLFGASTNQTMLNTPDGTDLDIDDFVFLRPHQSEFVLLQFGKLLVVRDYNIVDEWNILNNE